MAADRILYENRKAWMPKDSEWKEWLPDNIASLYIQARVDIKKTDDESDILVDHVYHWLNSNDKVLLLLGRAGSGKSTFCCYLVEDLWNKYQLCHSQFIPLYIPLLFQSSITDNLIESFLIKTYGFKLEEIPYIKKHYKLVIILDGYDEINTNSNLYRSNKFFEWDAKFIFTCRKEGLINKSKNYHDLFYPCDSKEINEVNKFQELSIKAFTKEDINKYLQLYVDVKESSLLHDITRSQMPFDFTRNLYRLEDKVQQDNKKLTDEVTEVKNLTSVSVSNTDKTENIKTWNFNDWNTYREIFDAIPTLHSFISSPFILSVIVRVLPDIVNSCPNETKLNQLRFTGMNIYDVYIKKLFNRQAVKVRSGELYVNFVEKNKEYKEWNLEQEFLVYSKRLATAMFQANITTIDCDISVVKSKKIKSLTEKEKICLDYFDDENDARLPIARSGCPLIVVGKTQYAFVHNSLLQYFSARQLFESTVMLASIALKKDLNKKLLDEPDTLRMMADQVKNDSDLKDILFELIEQSKHEPGITIAAANAVTILNYARISFAGRDWRDIRISGADLTYALLDGTDLTNGELMRVKFLNSWLRNTNFYKAMLDEARFDELPKIAHNCGITNLCYSNDKKWFAYSDLNGKIYLLDNDTWERKKTFELKGNILSKSEPVNTLKFSSDNDFTLLAAGSVYKQHIFLWHVQTLKKYCKFKLGISGATSLSFSSSSKFLAGISGSDIYIWDVTKKSEIFKVTSPLMSFNHPAQLDDLTFCNNNEQIAFLASSPRLFLYQIKEKELTQIPAQEKKGFNVDDIIMGLETVLCTDKSGQLIAITGNPGGGLYLCDIRKKTIKELSYHKNTVSSIAFSPTGRLLASGGSDQIVCLWDVNKAELLQIFKGHSERITSLDFCDEKTIASGSHDKTIHFWTISEKIQEKFGDVDLPSIRCISLNKNGDKLAALTDFTEIQILDANNGQYRYKMNSSSPVYPLCIAYNDEEQLLSYSSVKHLYDIHSGKLLTNDKMLTNSERMQSFSNAYFSTNKRFIGLRRFIHTDVGLWDTQIAGPIVILSNHDIGSINSVAFNINDTLLASAGSNGICVWDLNEKKCIMKQQSENPIYAICFHPDGDILASGDTTGKIKYWSLKNYSLLKIFDNSTDFIRTLAFSPNKRWLVSGGFDNAIYLWDATSGKRLAVLDGYQSSLIDCIWHPSNEKIITLSKDCTIRCWSIKENNGVFNLYLDWVKGKNALYAKNANFAQVTGLDSLRYELVKQLGAVGKNSQKSSETIIEQKNSLTLFEPNKTYSVFTQNGKLQLSLTNSVVTIVRLSKQQHAFLILETIEDKIKEKYYCIYRADLFIDLMQKTRFFQMRGEALIEIRRKSLSHIENIVKQCTYARSWSISSNQAESFCRNIQQDQKALINYFELGSCCINGFNCITWCKRQLSLIGISTKELDSRFDFIASVPSLDLPDIIPVTDRHSSYCLSHSK